MKIYTRTGDSGETGLFGGGRVSKSDMRVEAYGSVDELNAVVGWCVGLLEPIEVESAERLRLVQADLFNLGAHLATPAPREGRRKPELPPLPSDRIATMERWMDEWEAVLPPLTSFILPGGSESGSALHMCRTVCRRAERRVVALGSAEAIDPSILTYLNRLSDTLFVLARFINRRCEQPETTWNPNAR